MVTDPLLLTSWRITVLEDESGEPYDEVESNYAPMRSEPDIAQFVPKVERAMKAYAICKDRLDLVLKMLGRCLGDDKFGEKARWNHPTVSPRDQSAAA